MKEPAAHWPEVQLGDYVDLLTGFPFESSRFTASEEDVRLLRGDNVAQGVLRWAGAKRWTLSEYGVFDRFRLRRGDVILAMDRPWISAGLKYASISATDLPALLVQRVARMRGVKGLLTDYLRYVIGSPSFTNHVQAITTGVNVPHISGGDIKAFRFRLPPESFQRRVAAILSANDDLIENNTRRIAILEEMARLNYEEWFVRFRVPGHEGVPLVDSVVGPIPQGWEVKALNSVASVNPEQIKIRLPPERISYIDIASVSPGRIDQMTTMNFNDAPGRARRIVRGGDTIWSCVRPNRRSFAFIQDPGEDWVVSTGFAVLRPKANLANYVYCAVTTDSFVDYLIGRATGAAYPAVTAETFENAPIVIPPTEIISAFDQQVAPTLRLANILHRQNGNLRTQRDLLLPKLVSGEIDVSEAENGVLEAAE